MRPGSRTRPAPCRPRAAAAERRGAVAVPADRRLRVPVRLPHRRARRARRRDRLAVRAALRRAERVRHAARPPGAATSGSARSASTSRPARAYEPGTNTLVTTWQVPTGWLDGARRADARPAARRGHDHARTRGRRPTTTPTTCSCARSSASRASVEIELVCEPVFDYGRTPAEWTLVGDDRHTADASGAGLTIRLRTDMRARHRGRPRRAPATCCAGRAGLLRAVVGRGPRVARRRRRRRARGSRRRRASGAVARRARGSPTTAGASRSSAPRSRSRASRTCRPARPSPRSRRRCPRRRAASATGTTATRGSATRPSRCRRCTG